VFVAARPAETVATVTVRCDACRWDVAGSEAAVLAITLDGRYVQHLVVVRRGRADYRVLLGAVAAGSHTVRIDEDVQLTAPMVRGGLAVIERIVVDQISEADTRYRALSLAPFIYARPDTVWRFTDVPVLAWYEVEPTARGTRHRYSVVFTNEDGGTPADRLMATWGRTTDIEYVYSVEVDAAGAILAEDMQGPEHEILPYRGGREGRHPLLWVVTDNNMVLDTGETRIRHAPAPSELRLAGVSREVVMDANPWLYRLAADELRRERKIVPDAPPRLGTIPDPRRFVFAEACGDTGDMALAVTVRVGDQWFGSDRGVPEYRVTRNGCFRVAIPIPDPLGRDHLRAVRVEAHPRANHEARAPARLTRINTLFMLDDRYVPGSRLLTWQGSAELRAGGRPLEVPVP
jgi:hypothetical protein